MKAVLIEVNSDYSVALEKSGKFVKLNTLSNYNIGDEIDVYNRKSHIIRYSLIAATFVFALNICTFLFVWAMPYSYISMDINPSIEITTNRFNYIIKAAGINNDGSKVLQQTNLTNKSINTGLGIILDELTKENYLHNGKESTLVFAVLCNDQKNLQNIKQNINQIANAKINLDGSNEVYVFTGNINKHESAKRLNISAGKLMLIEAIQKTNEELKYDDLKNLKVKDIVDLAKTKKANAPKAKSIGDNSQINGNNNSNSTSPSEAILDSHKVQHTSGSIKSGKTTYQTPKQGNTAVTNKSGSAKPSLQSNPVSKPEPTATATTQPKTGSNSEEKIIPTAQPKSDSTSGEKSTKSGSNSGEKSAPAEQSKSGFSSSGKSAPTGQSKSGSSSSGKSTSAGQSKSGSSSSGKSAPAGQSKSDSSSSGKSAPAGQSKSGSSPSGKSAPSKSVQSGSKNK